MEEKFGKALTKYEPDSFFVARIFGLLWSVVGTVFW